MARSSSAQKSKITDLKPVKLKVNALERFYIISVSENLPSGSGKQGRYCDTTFEVMTQGIEDYDEYLEKNGVPSGDEAKDEIMIEMTKEARAVIERIKAGIQGGSILGKVRRRLKPVWESLSEQAGIPLQKEEED